MNPTSEVPN